jgi:outer membrane protein assembly factor BamB
MRFNHQVPHNAFGFVFFRQFSSKNGNILVYLVMLMVVFAVLGATMVSLFSTSVSSSATANESRRAFYLYESGLRYGMSELRNNKFTSSTIENLNSTTYNMNPEGSFEINVFTPWFESTLNQSVDSPGNVQLNLAKGVVPNGLLGKIPTSATFLRVVNNDYINTTGLGPQESAKATVSGRSLIDSDTIQLNLSDDFVVGKGENVCFSVYPHTGGQIIVPIGSLDLDPVARNIFPTRDGAIRVRNCEYFYTEAKDNGNRVTLLSLTSNQTICNAPMTVAADEEIILSTRNYSLTATGRSGNVTYGGDLDHSTGVTDHESLKAGGRKPDFAFDEEKDLLGVEGVLGKLVDPANLDFISENKLEKSLSIGGSEGPLLGAVWFRDTRNVGGIKNFCSGGRCLFGQGIRVFFTLEYSGSGDGLIFALLNGASNSSASVGGDKNLAELLGYSGDGRLNNGGTEFIPLSARNLNPPKVGLEFDAKVNFDSVLEQELKYCTGSSLSYCTRNDPGSSASSVCDSTSKSSGTKDAVHYVFWGNSSLNVPCRKEPYCGGVLTCKGDPSYDDNRHSAVGDGTQNWYFDTGSGNNADFVTSPALAADGTIYIGSQNNNRLYAVSSTGDLKWSFSTSGRVYSPTIGTNGIIFVGTDSGKLYAIKDNATNSSQEWMYSTPSGSAIRTKPVVSSDGYVYFGSDDGNLYAIFSSNGNLAWSFIDPFDPIAPVRSSPALSSTGNRIYFGSDNGTFYAVNTDTGLIAWKQTPSPFNKFRSSPTVSGGTVYVGSDNGRLYALNGTSGSIEWSFNTGEGVRSSPAVGNDGTIYFGSYNDNLYALNPDGSPKWPTPFKAGLDIESPITVDGNNHIYFGSNDNKVYALYADGSKKWSFTTGGDVRSKPFVKDDGTVYAWSFDFKLHAINQYANPKNYRDRLVTYDSGKVGGVTVAPSTPSDDWLTKGPWAVRIEIKRDQFPDADNYYSYELKTWLRQCNTSGCSGENDPIGTFYEDTRIIYSPDTPTARPAQLVQTIKLSAAQNQDFDRFIFGFTSQTGDMDIQTATIRKFQLSFIRPGDPTVTNDPNWP